MDPAGAEAEEAVVMILLVPPVLVKKLPRISEAVQDPEALVALPVHSLPFLMIRLQNQLPEVQGEELAEAGEQVLVILSVSVVQALVIVVVVMVAVAVFEAVMVMEDLVVMVRQAIQGIHEQLMSAI